MEIISSKWVMFLLSFLAKGEVAVFCPKCQGDFQEGVTYCRKCDEVLIDKLPSTETENDNLESSFSSVIGKLKRLRIENCLKYGGLAYIGLGIVADFIRVIVRDAPFALNFINILAASVQFLFNLLNTILWGFFFVALGKIIGLLKDNAKNE